MSSYLFLFGPVSLARSSAIAFTLLDFRQVKNELSASIYAIFSDTLLTFQDHFEHHFIRYGIYHVVNMFFRLVPFFLSIFFLSSRFHEIVFVDSFRATNYCMSLFIFTIPKSSMHSTRSRNDQGLLSKRYSVDEVVFLSILNLWLYDWVVCARMNFLRRQECETFAELWQDEIKKIADEWG